MVVFSVTTVVAEWDFKLRCIQQYYMCFVIISLLIQQFLVGAHTVSKLLLLEN